MFTPFLLITISDVLFLFFKLFLFCFAVCLLFSFFLLGKSAFTSYFHSRTNAFNLNCNLFYHFFTGLSSSSIFFNINLNLLYRDCQLSFPSRYTKSVLYYYLNDTSFILVNKCALVVENNVIY